MADVSVIGLGRMGSALARTFIAEGRSTCVWNRTAAKAQPLAELGAELAPTALAAVDASPVTVACVTNYGNLRSHLEQAPARAFEGHTIVNLTTGTPTEAHDMQALVKSKGGLYLDGHIPVYPRHIGLPETIIMYCGPSALWEENRAMLLALGPESLYFGEEIDSCNYFAAGVSSFYHVALASLFESLAYGLASKRSLDEMVLLIEHRRALLGDVIERSVRAIRDDNFEADEATMSIHLGAMVSFRETLRGAGQRSLLLDDTIRYLQEACDGGMDSLDMSALIKVMQSES
jgi:3-hydroxyisobutyrate dehydrogenase-like beta-hydroxyacid dehydrogenase